VNASDPLILKVKRLRPDAHLPTKAHATDMGFDLYAPARLFDRREGVHPIHTGIAVELPGGWAALILGRSSLASRGIFPLGGCMDPEYRGEWIVNLKVSRHECLSIEPGARIAQFVLVRVPPAVVVEVDELGESGRGERGFGSSGR
jgi:dUTP pyrophosphatase